MTRWRLPALLLVYFAVTISTLLFWNAHKLNSITGDEPHYLVMASGMARHATVEQTLPYREEFRTRAIFPGGLAARDAAPTPWVNAQAVRGPHGLFSLHNLGLPALLALPFLMGGVLGAKLAMVCAGALAVIWAWRFSGLFGHAAPRRFWAVLAACLSLPLIPAATQIYPDLLAGALAMIGLYGLWTANRARPLAAEATLAVAIAFLPWLQIKFGPAAAILLLSIMARIFAQARDYRRIGVIALIAALSAGALALYNHYAFGKLAGPYEADAVAFDLGSLMRFFGLFLDQNQGFLLENPVYFAGLWGVGAMWRLDRRFTLVWALVLLSLIVPNALHPLSYGGGSFSGRFGWSAAVVFIIPTLLALARLAEASPRLFRLAICLALALQAWFVLNLTVGAADLYNKTAGTWPDGYSIFWFPAQRWLPMLYDRSWAFGFLPNYAWLALALGLLTAGFLRQDRVRRRAGASAAGLAVLIAAAGLVRAAPASVTFQASSLPSQTGKTLGGARVAQAGIDPPGFLDFGPYFGLRRGRYEIVVDYSAAASPAQAVGTFDVFDSTSGKPLYQTGLQGTDGAVRSLSVTVGLGNWNTHLMEFRNSWNGSADLKVYAIKLRRR